MSDEPNDTMYDCEAKVLFLDKDTGKKVWRWERREVRTLGDRKDPDIRCMHCHGRVRIHRQQVEHGPMDHVEHLSRADSEHCRGGHYFHGEHRLSQFPVE